MPLETATYINQLEPANPAGTDQLAQGDDHLRMIKAVLKATFPNIAGPVTKTEAELNDTGFSMPVGLISIWYGDSASVPAGWAICNGQTVPLSAGAGTITTPNLVDRCVVGAGTVAARGATAGATTSSVTTGTAGAHTHTIAGGEHTHTGSVQDHALTLAQIPAHTHSYNTVRDGGGGVPGGNGGTTSPQTTGSAGSGQAHNHGLTIDANTHSHTASTEGAHSHSVQVSTVQPCMGLHYIMKV